MDLTVNLAPSNRDLKDPTTRQNFDDTVEQKRVIDLKACHNMILMSKYNIYMVVRLTEEGSNHY